jgi:uncharacterized protein (DUF2141 family)
MLILLLALMQVPGSRLHVDLQDLRTDKGVVYCALFRDANSWQKPDKALKTAKASIERTSAVCEFPDLSPGTYAVSTYHDENGNGKLDTNFIGKPKEGTGASNDAKGSMGPPKFDGAKFDLDTRDKSIVIHMSY